MYGGDNEIATYKETQAKIRRAKLNTICNYVTDNIEDLLAGLQVRYHRSHRLVYMPCPVHSGDNQQACNIYLDGDYLRGNWVCFTKNCHKNHGTSIISFVKGVLSNQQDKDCWFDYARDYCLDFLGLKYSEVPYDIDALSRQDFLKQSYIFHKLPSTAERTYNKEFVRASLRIPSSYMIGRGFSIDTLVKYDVGECNTPGKEMSGRAVFPVYDRNGIDMVGCVGRSIHPKCPLCNYYHNPNRACPLTVREIAESSKWRNSSKFPIRSYLYNLWNAIEPINKLQTVVIVEGQCDALKLVQAGVPNVVGIFGVDMSDEQGIILEQFNIMNAVVLLDNDRAGQEATIKIKNNLRRIYRVHTPTLPAHDVDSLNPTQLNELVNYIKAI